jgi:hypothetical protein
MTTNHTSMTGPKARPMRAVPCGWIANRASRMATAAGGTNVCSDGAICSTPSSAESTEIAGVIAPSP